jgi:hypothetical protein
MNKIGLNLARMAWPIDPYGRQQTHSETCYTSHAGCAVHRLADEIEMLRKAIGEFVQHDESGWHGIKWCDAVDRLYEIADEAKEQA